MSPGKTRKRRKQRKRKSPWAVVVTWTGTDWLVDCPLPPNKLAPGMEFVAEINRQKTSGQEMFPAGTVLYLLLEAKKNQQEIYRISGEHWMSHRHLCERPKKELVPICLTEPLMLRDNERLVECRCRIERIDRSFSSVRKAAQFAVERWTLRKNAAINAFEGVHFVHSRRLLPLKCRRDELLHGVALEQAEPAEFTGSLFGDDDWSHRSSF